MCLSLPADNSISVGRVYCEWADETVYRACSSQAWLGDTQGTETAGSGGKVLMASVCQLLWCQHAPRG